VVHASLTPMAVCEITGADRASLFAAIRHAWAADTSIDSEWSVTCPARGQCAVTALVIQDYLGGQLIRAEVEGVSHYWNRVKGGEVDLTRDQFTQFVPTAVAIRSRRYVLAFPDTIRRYKTLKERVAMILGQG
jgi:hypothetical protein